MVQLRLATVVVLSGTIMVIVSKNVLLTVEEKRSKFDDRVSHDPTLEENW
jgi:hypothetical protein